MKNNKKFRYGSMAIAYTALVIVAILILNIIVSALGNSLYSFFHIDMTKEQLYEISDTTRVLFDDMKSGLPEDKKDELKVKIVFMSSETAIANTSYLMMKQIYEMAKQYEEEFDFIELEFIEPNKTPEKVQKYLLHSVDKTSQTITTTDIYFEGPDGKYISVPYTLFYLTDSSLSSGDKYTLFNIESKMTGSILQLFSTDAIAYITTGHGEYTTLTELRELLAIAGYTVKDIDLTKEDFDYEKGKLVIVNSPKKDFGGVNSDVNEIKKLSDFVDYDKVPHHMLTFIDSEYSANGNLSELLSLMQDYGIYYSSSVVTEGTSNALSDDKKTIVGTYVTKEESTSNSRGLGYSFISTIKSLEIKTLIKNASAMKIEATNSSSLSDDYYVDSIITISNSATVTNLEDSSQSFNSGYKTLLAISGRDIIVDNASTYTSYVLAGSSSSFVSDEYLKTYGNRDIVYAALKSMSLNSIDPDVVNISYKQYLSEGLTITEGQQIIWTIVVTAILPVAISIVGVVVWVRRKNR